MFVHFSFENGSNPYIAKTMEEVFRMIVKYNCGFADTLHYEAGHFVVCGEERGWKRTKYAIKIRREDYKDILREFAIDWSLTRGSCENLEALNYWSEFFYHYGKRYGLLKEFRENWIC